MSQFKNLLHFRILFCILTVISVSSCSEIQFTAPHPSDEKCLKTIDSQIIGTYVWNDSVLRIKNKEPYYNEGFYQGVVNQLDSFIFAVGSITITSSLIIRTNSFSNYYKGTISDTAKFRSRHSSEKQQQIGNYLVYKTESVDTLLNLTKRDRLYVLNGKYYLNRFNSKKEWEIFQFEKKSDGTFSINLTSSEDKEQLLPEKKELEPIFLIASISNKEFKDFVKNGGFRARYSLVKIP